MEVIICFGMAVQTRGLGVRGCVCDPGVSSWNSKLELNIGPMAMSI